MRVGVRLLSGAMGVVLVGPVASHHVWAKAQTDDCERILNWSALKRARRLVLLLGGVAAGGGSYAYRQHE